MKLMIGWFTAVAVLASPCAWDTSPRELWQQLQHKAERPHSAAYSLIQSLLQEQA